MFLDLGNCGVKLFFVLFHGLNPVLADCFERLFKEGVFLLIDLVVDRLGFRRVGRVGRCGGVKRVSGA